MVKAQETFFASSPNTVAGLNSSQDGQESSPPPAMLRALVNAADFAECSRILVGRKYALVTAVDWPLVYYQYENQPPREIIHGGQVEDLAMPGLGPIKHRNLLAASSKGMFFRELSWNETQELHGDMEIDELKSSRPFRLMRGYSIGNKEATASGEFGCQSSDVNPEGDEEEGEEVQEFVGYLQRIKLSNGQVHSVADDFPCEEELKENYEPQDSSVFDWTKLPNDHHTSPNSANANVDTRSAIDGIVS